MAFGKLCRCIPILRLSIAFPWQEITNSLCQLHSDDDYDDDKTLELTRAFLIGEHDPLLGFGPPDNVLLCVMLC